MEKPILSRSKNDKEYNYFLIKEFINSTQCELLSPLSEYNGRTTRLRIKCGDCNSEFTQTFEYFSSKNKHMCKGCERKNQIEKQTNKLEHIHSKLKEYGLVLQGDYSDTLTPITVKCDKCNNTRQQSFQSVIAKSKKYCYSCNKSESFLINRKNKISKIKKEFGKNLLSVDYEDVKKPIILTLKCDCGVVYDIEYHYAKYKRTNICCKKCIKSGKSKFEFEVGEYIESLGIKIIRSDRTLVKPKEIDIYIPSHNLAIECDGIYFHTESKGKDRNYHLNKTKECEEKGVQLLHIWDSEWEKKEGIVKSILKSKLGLNERIGARKCDIIEVSKRTKKDFLNMTHIQGNDKASIIYGLVYKGDLVSVMSFCKSRYDKKIDWEISRYSSRNGINVVGGASRLLKNFQKNHSGSIITYADRRYSNGNLYKQLGLKETHSSKPNYFYVMEGEFVGSRLNFQKHKLKDRLEIYDSNLSEWDNMKNNEYDKMWDCGNLVFTSF